MEKDKVLPIGSRVIVQPKYSERHKGSAGVIIFSQKINDTGFHDVYLDAGLELPNLAGEELDPAPALCTCEISMIKNGKCTACGLAWFA